MWFRRKRMTELRIMDENGWLTTLIDDPPIPRVGENISWYPLKWIYKVESISHLYEGDYVHVVAMVRRGIEVPDA